MERVLWGWRQICRCAGYVAKWPAERVFLAIASTFGLLLIFIMPPMQAPDELSHFFRAFQVSDGQIVASKYTYGTVTTIGGELPESVKQAAYRLQGAPSGGQKIPTSVLKEELQRPLLPTVQGTAQFAGAALYSPMPYLPQAFGIGIGRLLKASPLMLIYMGRLCNLIVALGLLYLAIRWIPFGKWGMVVLALLPTTLTQAASLSADAMTTGLAFLTIALFLRLYQQARPFSYGWLALLGGLIAALALTKPAFIVLAALPFLLPAKSFLKLLPRWQFGLIVAALAVGLAVWWSHLAGDFVPYMVAALKPDIVVSTSEQLVYVLAHPFNFVHAMLSSLLGLHGSDLIISFVGTQFSVPLSAVVLSYATLLGVWLYDGRPKKLIPSALRYALLGVAVASVFAICGALYLTYNEIGSSTVEGLNGRYFMPLAPLAMVVVMTSGWRLHIPRHGKLLLAAGLLLPLVGTLAKLSNDFFGWHF